MLKKEEFLNPSRANDEICQPDGVSVSSECKKIKCQDRSVFSIFLEGHTLEYISLSHQIQV